MAEDGEACNIRMMVCGGVKQTASSNLCQYWEQARSVAQTLNFNVRVTERNRSLVTG